MAPPRVLLLNERDPSHPLAGGAEIHVAEIFQRLAASGFEVTQLSCRHRGASEREMIGGVDVRRLGRIRAYYPRVAWICARETAAGRYDVVVECLNKVPFYSPLYSSAPVLPLCHHLFGEVAFQQVAWPLAATVWASERLVPMVYRSRPFITISESTRDDLVARGISPDSIRVSHCGTTPCAVPIDLEKRRPRRVAYVGRLQTYKRVDMLLRAGALLTERFPDLELVVIGRGPARAGLERLAEELGVKERTRFTGFVSDQERDAILSECRVAVCASPKEGWGLTVIECNRAGTPVVATDAPGLRDSVRDGETGILVKGDQPADFANALATLLGDDAFALQMARSAFEWSKHFDWDRAAADMAEAISEAGERG